MAENGVSIVTPTSDRPEAFALCECYVRRFTMPACPIEWVIVDDGRESATDHLPLRICDAIDVHVHRPPQATSPRESFRMNYQKAFEACRYERIIILEDDDWYHPDYLVMMSALLDIRPLVGCAHARVYNVRYRCYKVHANSAHASLAQTGFRKSIFGDAVRGILETRSTPEQLDGHLWRRANVAEEQKLLLPNTAHHASLKALAGKPGIGVGHTLENVSLESYADDPDIAVLQQWIGSDYVRYMGYLEGERPR